jgi:hypothetical protein
VKGKVAMKQKVVKKGKLVMKVKVVMKGKVVMDSTVTYRHDDSKSVSELFFRVSKISGGQVGIGHSKVRENSGSIGAHSRYRYLGRTLESSRIDRVGGIDDLRGGVLG